MALEFNFDDALRALEQLEKRVSNKMSDEVLKEGAEVMLVGQKEDVPIGDTGKLKSSLGVGKIKRRKGVKVIQVGIVKDTQREIIYGYYQHYGTRRMIGSYWMTTAFNKKIQEAREVMKEKLIESVKGK